MSQSKSSSTITGREIKIVGVVVLGAFVSLLNQTVMSPALPKLMADFGLEQSVAQWVTSIYMLVNGIMVPISGYLMDKFSTRKLFTASLGAFVAGSALCAVAPGFGILLVGRVLQAAGAGVMLPLVATVPLLVFPVEKRGTAMGMAGIVMAAGPAIGPVVGGAVIDSMGWRAMLWGIAALAAVILVAGVFLLENVGELKSPTLDVPSVILTIVAFGLLLYGFSSASDMGWTNPVIVACILVGAVALVLFVRRQLRLEQPLLNLSTLKVRRFAVAAIVVTLINAAVAGTNVFLPIFLQNVLGVSAFTTGMVMLPAAIVGIVLSPVTGVLFDRRGPRGLAISGMVVLAGALLALGGIGMGTSVIVVGVLCALQATGQALANMPVNTWGVNGLSDDLISHGNAVANTGRQVFGAVATALTVTVMSSTQASSMAAGATAVEACAAGVASAYFACAIVAVIGLVICLVFVRDTKRRAA